MSDEAQRWRELNRANWDERTKIHLGPGSDYDLDQISEQVTRLWANAIGLVDEPSDRSPSSAR